MLPDIQLRYLPRVRCRHFLTLMVVTPEFSAPAPPENPTSIFLNVDRGRYRISTSRFLTMWQHETVCSVSVGTSKVSVAILWLLPFLIVSRPHFTWCKYEALPCPRQNRRLCEQDWTQQAPARRHDYSIGIGNDTTSHLRIDSTIVESERKSHYRCTFTAGLSFGILFLIIKSIDGVFVQSHAPTTIRRPLRNAGT
jgi:hypothetical protein